MKTVIRVILIIVTIAILTTCNDNPSDITPLSKEQITGFAQKGPFNNGSSVLISELNSDFVQTGRNITSNIKNNQGAYEIDDIEFISQYVTINTNGYYFNEVTGENSSSQLTLYAISFLLLVASAFAGRYATMVLVFCILFLLIGAASREFKK